MRYPRSKRRYLELENCKTYENKTVSIGWYLGKKKMLISEEILSGVDMSPKYLFASIIGGVILIEDKDF